MTDYQDFEFLTITQLGHIFGVGRRVMGQWLVKAGLRDSELNPSRHALDNGLCKMIRNDRDIVFVAWHRNKSIAALRAAGYAPSCEQPETILATGLVGPFSMHPTSEDGFQIRNGDGTCCVFVRGQRVAKQVVALFNYVDGRGGFGE